MTKKDISEIRKTLSPEKTGITKMAACIVDEDGNAGPVSTDGFPMLQEEEQHKILGFFKKALGGKLGRNALELPFPIEEEREGGRQAALMGLLGSWLEDPDRLSSFIGAAAGAYEAGGKYAIILACGSYDVPRKASDGAVLEGAEDTFNYLMGCICPIRLTDGALGPEGGRLRELPRRAEACPPDKGFLFPAFSGGAADIHSMLYYTKSAKEAQPGFAEGAFGCRLPLSADEQAEGFAALVTGLSDGRAAAGGMVEMGAALNELMEREKDGGEPLSLGREDVRELVRKGGVSTEGFDRAYEEAFGSAGAEVLAGNIIGASGTKIKGPDVEITAKPGGLWRIEARKVDGRDCIVVLADSGVEVNGVPVGASAPQE